MIIVGMEYNFNKKTTSEIDSLGTPYDFSSMMHYGADAFGIRGATTIQTKDPSKQRLIGNQNGFSEIDIKQLGLMYKNICKGMILFFPNFKMLSLQNHLRKFQV